MNEDRSKLVTRCFCFICGNHGGAWLLSKKGKPFFKCTGCCTTIFINTEPGLRGIEAIQDEILGTPARFEAVVMRTVSLSQKPVVGRPVSEVLNESLGKPAKAANPGGSAD